MKNYYDILGVSRNASIEQIKTAYRMLSKKFHPDINNGEEFFSDMFKQVNEAYKILCDSGSRKAYDLLLYKFENPETISQNSFQESQSTARPKKSNQDTFSLSIEKWKQVKKWRTMRNILLMVNLILLLLISFSVTKYKINYNSPASHHDFYKPITTFHHHKRKHKIIKLKGTTEKRTIDTSKSKEVDIIKTEMEIKSPDSNKRIR